MDEDPHRVPNPGSAGRHHDFGSFGSNCIKRKTGSERGGGWMWSAWQGVQGAERVPEVDVLDISSEEAHSFPQSWPPPSIFPTA